MSERYECVLVPGSRSAVQRAFRNLRSARSLGFGELDQDLFAVYVKVGRLVDPTEDTEIAVSMSLNFGKSLLVLYDNSCGLRFAALYQAGVLANQFGESEEVWVLLDEHGHPIMDGEQFSVHDLKDNDDEEYDCIHNAIDAGLGALGVTEGLDSERLKQKVCYEFDHGVH